MRENHLSGRVYMSKKLNCYTCSCHKTREDSFDFVVTFQGFYNGVKYDFAKFVSYYLNLEVPSCHLDHCATFAILVLYVISGFSVTI